MHAHFWRICGYETFVFKFFKTREVFVMIIPIFNNLTGNRRHWYIALSSSTFSFNFPSLICRGAQSWFVADKNPIVPLCRLVTDQRSDTPFYSRRKDITRIMFVAWCLISRWFRMEWWLTLPFRSQCFWQHNGCFSFVYTVLHTNVYNVSAVYQWIPDPRQTVYKIAVTLTSCLINVSSMNSRYLFFLLSFIYFSYIFSVEDVVTSRLVS